VDGIKERLRDSLQARLSLWLSLAILSVALVAGVFSFVAAFGEAHELQDDVLRQVASLFDHQHLPLPHPDDSGRLPDSDEESRVIVQYLPASGATSKVGETNPSLALPATLHDGIQTFTLGNEEYRILVKTLASGERIAVAQETGLRNEIARDSALRTVMPFLILVPILFLVVADLIRKMFRPITTLSAEIDQRSEQELHPFTPERLPVEVRPFVIAINRLLGRVSRSMDIQRRFVADAAHELRSPLTALSLQAERLADAEMSEAARERLATLRRGIERGRALMDQLLTLARAQSTVATMSNEVSVQQVFRRALEILIPLAEAKNIDIGVESELDPMVLTDETDLVTIVKNLLDNAIRYTPPGGRIDLAVEVTDHHVILQVRDTGAGISAEEQSRVFDPFYRAPGSDEMGSGLGLAIVQAIADRIGAEVSMGYAAEQSKIGLCVNVKIPRNG
jgi:two-component system OmpR family sensor kinase